MVGSFLGIYSLVFSETQHGVKGPYGVASGRFFEKNISAQKMWKMGQKMDPK